MPGTLLAKFTSRDAFIYVLEILAQVIPLVVCRQWMPTRTWCWCDNEAGKAALQRGYGREAKVNHQFSMTWSYLTLAQVEPHFRRVPSSANISDPISRHDLERATAEGWIRVVCDWAALYDLLLKGAKSTEAAFTVAQQLLYVNSSLQPAQQHGVPPLAPLWCSTAVKQQSKAANVASFSKKSCCVRMGVRKAAEDLS